jgi:hypothetical protein
VPEKTAKGRVERRWSDKNTCGGSPCRRFVHELDRAAKLDLQFRPLAAEQRRERPHLLDVGMVWRRKNDLGYVPGMERAWVCNAKTPTHGRRLGGMWFGTL